MRQTPNLPFSGVFTDPSTAIAIGKIIAVVAVLLIHALSPPVITINAATIRLRPILMTSFATIFGILPIAIGLGAGAESRRPLGLAVVGGMFFSTFLTLVIVPVVYTLLARFTLRSKQTSEVLEKSSERITDSAKLVPEG